MDNWHVLFVFCMGMYIVFGKSIHRHTENNMRFVAECNLACICILDNELRHKKHIIPFIKNICTDKSRHITNLCKIYICISHMDASVRDCCMSVFIGEAKTFFQIQLRWSKLLEDEKKLSFIFGSEGRVNKNKMCFPSRVGNKMYRDTWKNRLGRAKKNVLSLYYFLTGNFLVGQAFRLPRDQVLIA